MPFKSEAQKKYLFMKKPKLAHKWAKKYGIPKNMPKHKNLNKMIMKGM